MLDEQHRIIEELGVMVEFDVERERERRIDFLATYLESSGAKAYVLGISGGVDSLTAALLAQEAVRRLCGAGYAAEFIAVRLPYGVQADEGDAQLSLGVIQPDRVVTVNIQTAADAMLTEVGREAGDLFASERKDFHLGNIKARQRMIAQYAIAGAARGLVIGTDHAAEALMGFFTKFGDGAADVVPLTGLNKRRVRAVRVQWARLTVWFSRFRQPIWRQTRRSSLTRTRMVSPMNRLTTSSRARTSSHRPGNVS